MNINYAEQLKSIVSAKDKMNIIRTICLIEKAKNKLYEQQEKSNSLLNKIANKNQSKELSKLQKTFEFMEKQNANMIKDYFFNNRIEATKENMSSSTFYRLRKNAIEEFIYHYLTK
ncbi:hypothetical protein [Mycoplasmopsis primatum]|uniref:hypothetical protein n=1 Tax=Mycoplasmopsis primatum TaxID=55604 RepID=UPI000497801E|nr:hypothetical protein [Mycoplasmopsis primatum]